MAHPEFCEDTQCEPNTRIEYCTKLGTQATTAEVALLLEKIDDIVYTDGDVTAEDYWHTVSSDGQAGARSLRFIDGDFRGWVWPPVEHGVTIAYETGSRPSHRRFSVSVSWLVKQYGLNRDTAAYEPLQTKPVKTTYDITEYQSGSVQGWVQQPNTVTGEYEGRPMTPYDFADLYTNLDRAHDMWQSEIADNARSGGRVDKFDS